jgi:hypothetical protein
MTQLTGHWTVKEIFELCPFGANNVSNHNVVLSVRPAPRRRR